MNFTKTLLFTLCITATTASFTADTVNTVVVQPVTTTQKTKPTAKQLAITLAKKAGIAALSATKTGVSKTWNFFKKAENQFPLAGLFFICTNKGEFDKCVAGVSFWLAGQRIENNQQWSYPEKVLNGLLTVGTTIMCLETAHDAAHHIFKACFKAAIKPN